MDPTHAAGPEGPSIWGQNKNLKAGETKELCSHISPFLSPLPKQQVKATGRSPAVPAASSSISHEIPAVGPTPPPPPPLARSRTAKQRCRIPAGRGAAQGDGPCASVPAAIPRECSVPSGSVTGGEPPASGSPCHRDLDSCLGTARTGQG